RSGHEPLALPPLEQRLGRGEERPRRHEEVVRTVDGAAERARSDEAPLGTPPARRREVALPRLDGEARPGGEKRRSLDPARALRRVEEDERAAEGLDLRRAPPRD